MITFKQFGNYGRLGNQMFQFATLKGIAAKCNYDFGLPINDITKTLEINNFDNFCKNYKELNITTIDYVEPYFHFNQQVFENSDNTNYLGYFQSEKYFSHIKEDIINIFSIKTIEENIKTQLDYICKKNNTPDGCVSIHVRHGDYLNYPLVHPICSLGYYQQCINELNKIGNFTYLIFSDDENWCKFAFEKFSNIEYPKTQLGLHCILYMKHCQHNVIANSSFSWWGGYLNQHKNKKVFAPKQWFGKNGPQDVYDLYMQDWIIV